MNYRYDCLLLEKELLIKMQEDEINFLKKKTTTEKKVTFIGDLLIINKYTNFGVSLDYLLNHYKIKRSTFYFKSRLFFAVNRYNRKNKCFKGYSLNTKGEKIYDVHIKKLLVDLLSIDDPNMLRRF